MAVDWLNFKSLLGGSANTYVVYIDDEGSEIPIESECEFQEAIKLAKLNKNQMKIILYYNKPKPNKKAFENQYKNSNNIPLQSQSVKADMMSQDIFSKKIKCHCNEDVPPEWFTHYMKKFRKELLQELKANISETIHSAIDKEKRVSKIKREAVDLPCHKVDTPLTGIISQSRKKKKGLEKDLGDLLDQREIKLAKKIEKLHPTKHERLEKLDSKTRVSVEEKRRLLERKRHSKQRLERNFGVFFEKEIFGKSVSYHENEVFLFLPPNSEFVVTLNFTNDGIIMWKDPWLECFDFAGLYPKEVRISLPRLLPTETGFTTLSGRVCDREGLHHFKCRFFDGLERFGPEFTCWARVELNEYDENFLESRVNFGKPEERKRDDSVGVLIDFEKDEFAATRKKIEDNISEIERKLQGIDFLRPSAPAVSGLRQPDTEVAGERQRCDRRLMREENEENRKKTPGSDRVVYSLSMFYAEPKGGFNDEAGEEKDEKARVEEREELQKTADLDSSYDSELSVLIMSEDDNFSMLSLQSKSPSPEESVNEDKKLFGTDLGKSGVSEERVGFNGQQNVLPPMNEASENKVLSESGREQLEFDIINKERLFFEEEVLKPKPMKSGSTEYRFTAENLTQPTFVQERFGKVRPFRFTFTGEPEEQKSSPEGVFEGPRSRIFSQDTRERKPPQEGVFEGFRSRLFPQDTQERKPPPKGVFEGGLRSRLSSQDAQERKPPPEGVFEEWRSRILSQDTEEMKPPPEGVFEGRRSRHSSAGNKTEKSRAGETLKNEGVATADASGKIIYAVNSSGNCFPVKDLLNGQENWKTSWDNTNSRRRERKSENSRRDRGRHDPLNEAPGVNVLPSALMNGASNMASLAFNTAKSVINTFFTSEGAESKKPAWDNYNGGFTPEMTYLLDMGFPDIILNQELLLAHKNDLAKVVDVLLSWEENGTRRNS